MLAEDGNVLIKKINQNFFILSYLGFVKVLKLVALSYVDYLRYCFESYNPLSILEKYYSRLDASKGHELWSRYL